MKLKCPNGCVPKDFYGNPVDTPFFYSVQDVRFVLEMLGDHETAESGDILGVLVYPDGKVSNRWTDGTAGVNAVIRDELDLMDRLPYCLKCYTEAEWEKP